MLKRVLSLLLVLAMVFSISVGCAKQEPAPAEEKPAEETPAAETPAGEEDYLVWNIAVDPETWDPTLNSAADCISINGRRRFPPANTPWRMAS